MGASRLSALWVIALVVAPLAYAAGGAEDRDCEPRFSRLLNPEWIAQMRHEVENGSPESAVLRNAVQHNGFTRIALNEEVIRNHTPTYTNELPKMSITDQQNSGRCWIFASCNMVRQALINKGKVPEDFEFSQAYVHFFNMLEKSDKWITEAGSRLKPGMTENDLMKVFNDYEDIGDGGFFEFFDFLVARYGLVPKQVMRETASSLNTDVLQTELKTHLAAVADEMKDAYKGFEFSKAQKKLNARQRAKLQEIREKGMKGIYKILAAHLGVPPAEFQFRLKNGQAKTFSPQSFAKEFVGIDPRDYVVVASDPFSAKNRVYTVPNSSIGVPGAGDPMTDHRFLNVSVDRMKQLVEKSIDQKHAVWFAADVGSDVDLSTGIMHPDIFKRQPIYGFSASDKPQAVTSRREKLFYGLSSPNHAMTFTGYDKPKIGKNTITIKYKVDNSWSTQYGDEGVFHMYTPWFDKYVYEIIVPKSALNPKEQKLWKGKAKPYKEPPI